MSTFRIAFVATALLACNSSNRKHQLTAPEMVAADPLPLKKGAKWTYEVTVKRFDVDTDRQTISRIAWTTEVLDAHESNGVVAYRVKGWPSDLDSDQAPVATEKTLLRHGNAFLFGATADPSLDGATGWFSWPVMDGRKICPSTQDVYCWQVTAIDNGYSLSLYAGPDEQTFELEPGTGVSRFHFKRPTNEVEAKLVTYTSGR
jgi:hypothetical protein